MEPVQGADGKVLVISSEGPFAAFKAPTPEDCREARDRLAVLHAEFLEDLYVRRRVTDNDSGDDRSSSSVLDALVRTILSQNTTDVTSARAFEKLKRTFAAWEDVLAADPASVVECIREGGLAEVKVQRIQSILQTLKEERGVCSMEYLRELQDDAIKADLSRYKGVGPKTVSCVLLFCMARPDFPVDTHVWRISKRLGWVPTKATRDQTYLHLNLRVPDDIKFDLHVLLVEHGKRCEQCASNNRPRRAPLGRCPLQGLLKRSMSQPDPEPAGKLVTDDSRASDAQKRRKLTSAVKYEANI